MDDRSFRAIRSGRAFGTVEVPMYVFGARKVAAFSLGVAAAISLASCGGGGGGSGGSSSGRVVTFTTDAVPAATTGVPYLATVAADFPHPPGVYKVTAGTIPPGVTFDQNTGVLQGFPNQIGIF